MGLAKEISFGKRLENALHAVVAFVGGWKCRHVWTDVNPKKIVFNQFQGSGFGCNPKYIALELLKRRSDLDLVWLARNPSEVQVPDGIRIIKWKGTQALKELATAGVWVSNHNLGNFVKNRGLVKKPGQRYYQTWHGSFGIKRCTETLSAKEAQMLDGFIANCSWEAELAHGWFGDGATMHLFGHPRNDVIVSGKCRESADKRTLLYVPTFRDDGSLDAYLTDFTSVVAAITERWPAEWKVQVRLHPNMRKKGVKLSFVGDVEDVTDYPDIQELLASADIVISDYSSCIFDFALSHRPAFIYAPDCAKYETDRGFYYPLSQTPFPVAKSVDELLAAIKSFDEIGYGKRLLSFFTEKGACEDAHASERVADLILGQVRCV